MMGSATIRGMLLCAMVFFTACARHDEVKIRRLERKFREAKADSGSVELANRLHRMYSLHQMKNPGDTVFLLHWVKLEVAGNEPYTALKCLNRYIGLTGGNTAVLKERAEIAAALGFYSMAARDFKTASVLSAPGYERMKMVRQSAYYANLDSTLGALDRELASDEQAVGPRLERAGFFIRNLQPNAARFDIDFILRDRPDNAAAIYLSAVLNFEYKHFDACLADLKQYVAFADASDSNQAAAQGMRHRALLFVQGREMKQRLGSEPDNYALLLEYGISCFKLKDYETSLAVFSRLVTEHPDSLIGRIYRGQAFLQTGRYGEALKDFDTVLAIDPGKISCHNLKAYTFLLMNDSVNVRKETARVRALGGNVLDILKDF